MPTASPPRSSLADASIAGGRLAEGVAQVQRAVQGRPKLAASVRPAFAALLKDKSRREREEHKDEIKARAFLEAAAALEAVPDGR